MSRSVRTMRIEGTEDETSGAKRNQNGLRYDGTAEAVPFPKPIFINGTTEVVPGSIKGVPWVQRHFALGAGFSEDAHQSFRFREPKRASFVLRTGTYRSR